MIDEDFDFFLEEFGEPTDQVTAEQEEIEAYRGILPDKLLEYWQAVGFSGFMDGLFWITNPAEFEDVLEIFLAETDFADYDNYHVIARSAYGKLYLWGERTGDSLEIIPHLNWIETNIGKEEDIKNGESDLAIQYFFSNRDPKYVDIESKSKPLFPAVLKKHGAVGKDEVMVFNPYLFMGGTYSPAKMSKENLHIFLQLMAEMGGAEIVDMATMVGNVVKYYGE